MVATFYRTLQSNGADIACSITLVFRDSEPNEGGRELVTTFESLYT